MGKPFRKKKPRSEGQVYHVRAELAGNSLSGALRRWRPQDSWSSVRRLIASRQVQVNGNLCLDEGRRLQPGEVVKVLPHPLAPPPRETDVKIRYVDAHLVVVEKPAGMTSIRHPEEEDWPTRRKQRQPTLDEVLPVIVARLTRNKSAPEKKPRRETRSNRGSSGKGKPPRLRAVHRLDRDTSGLMVFARSVPAERDLVQQFRRHTIQRKYVAVVHGHPSPRTITSQLVRDRGDGRRGSTTLPDVGQRATTHVRPLEVLGDYSLVECRLETGRTHQIRIHLSEAGHFVCGDKVYSQPLFQPPQPDRSGAPRLALHAAELGFVHPITGESLEFQMRLPKDLAQFVERLRKGAPDA